MKRGSLTILLSTVAVFALLLHALTVLANQFGRTEATRKNGTGCNGIGCHGDNPSQNVLVSILGPDTLSVGQPALYSVTIKGGPAIEGGTNIAASSGTLAIMPGDALLKVFQGELTHQKPTPFLTSEILTFYFFYTAPSTPGQQILYANGNSVNGNRQPTGDEWNYAPDKRITVINPATMVGNHHVSFPQSFALSQNYPNPFNPSTVIGYEVSKQSRVTLKVFDMTGREIATLVNEERLPGRYQTQFVPPPHLPSGTYLYRLIAGSFSDQKKMTLVR